MTAPTLCSLLMTHFDQILFRHINVVNQGKSESFFFPSHVIRAPFPNVKCFDKPVECEGPLLQQDLWFLHLLVGLLVETIIAFSHGKSSIMQINQRSIFSLLVGLLVEPIIDNNMILSMYFYTIPIFLPKLPIYPAICSISYIIYHKSYIIYHIP